MDSGSERRVGVRPVPMMCTMDGCGCCVSFVSRGGFTRLSEFDGPIRDTSCSIVTRRDDSSFELLLL